jgi:hypothetical protein
MRLRFVVFCGLGPVSPAEFNSRSRHCPVPRSHPHSPARNEWRRGKRLQSSTVPLLAEFRFRGGRCCWSPNCEFLAIALLVTDDSNAGGELGEVGMSALVTVTKRDRSIRRMRRSGMASVVTRFDAIGSPGAHVMRSLRAPPCPMSSVSTETPPSYSTSTSIVERLGRGKSDAVRI